MEPNELMNTEDVVKTTVEVITEDSGNGLGMAVAGGLVVIGGITLYKYVLKPLATKIKTKKEQKVTVQVYEANEMKSTETEEFE